MTINRAKALAGQSNKLYITSCRFVHNKSSYKIQIKKMKINTIKLNNKNNIKSLMQI